MKFVLLSEANASTDSAGRSPQHQRPRRGHLRLEQAAAQQADLAELADLRTQTIRLGGGGRPDAREAGHEAVRQRAMDLPARRVESD